MPLYEYECLGCKKISQHLILTRDNFTPFCKKCGSYNVKKIISRVTIRLSEETRLEKLADPNLIEGLEKEDPKSIEKFAGKMGSIIDDGFDGNMKHLVEEAMDTNREED